MRLLILGGNGRTGQLVVSQALERGFTVTALVRKPESVQPAPGLHLVQGTPLKQEDIEKAFAATPEDPVQSVVVALNASRATDSPFAKVIAPPTFLQDCVRNAVAVMEARKVRKIVILSAFGVGDSSKNLSFIFRAVLRYTNMSVQMVDHEMVDRDMHQNTALDWTLVKPGMLKDGDVLPIRETGEEGEGASSWAGISRASVAKFLLDVVEESKWDRKSVVITN